MTELDPCLAGCDAALAEAELLLALLGGAGVDGAVLDPVKRSIVALRREVDRLRGIKVVSSRRKTGPFWANGSGGESPWPTSNGPGARPA